MPGQVHTAAVNAPSVPSARGRAGDAMAGGGGRAIVVLADVAHSRDAPGVATAWLRGLAGDLNRSIPRPERLAEFAFTQGDELQGLLRVDGDPLRAVLIGSLAPDALPMRWVVVAGRVASGRGPATQRSGEAFYAARALISGRGPRTRRRDGLQMRTGSAAHDPLLEDLAPLLAELLAELTPRQRELARLALLEGLRQADAADRLGVSRAAMSVGWGRARVRALERLTRALRTIFRDGVRAAGEQGGEADGAAPSPTGRT